MPRAQPLAVLLWPLIQLAQVLANWFCSPQEVLPAKRRTVEVGKHQSIGGVSQRRRITGLVRPGLKVHRFGRADADQDAQHFHTAGPLRHCRVEAVAALLDRRKVESRRVGDRLDVIGRGQVGIGSGDCRKLPTIQAGDCLRKHVYPETFRTRSHYHAADHGIEGQTPDPRDGL